MKDGNLKHRGTIKWTSMMLAGARQFASEMRIQPQ